MLPLGVKARPACFVAMRMICSRTVSQPNARCVLLGDPCGLAVRSVY